MCTCVCACEGHGVCVCVRACTVGVCDRIRVLRGTLGPCGCCPGVRLSACMHAGVCLRARASCFSAAHSLCVCVCVCVCVWCLPYHDRCPIGDCRCCSSSGLSFKVLAVVAASPPGRPSLAP